MDISTITTTSTTRTTTVTGIIPSFFFYFALDLNLECIISNFYFNHIRHYNYGHQHNNNSYWNNLFYKRNNCNKYISFFFLLFCSRYESFYRYLYWTHLFKFVGILALYLHIIVSKESNDRQLLVFLDALGGLKKEIMFIFDNGPGSQCGIIELKMR